ncbi:MAG: tRNA uridine-5-carboxymethylaminomethyl(34) synthesis GTPase MnmE [Eubacteriales bacterium]|nr:tRNA uridine-5-carboxymethylaminomethyl(34) synthesis GTPase MnmE [Eubacteriales bacterium]
MELTTIAAVATPPGKGGLAAIRVSGPEALKVMRQVFVPKSPATAFQPRYMMYGHFVDGDRTLDECMAVYLKAPYTYTREDVAELFLHGGEYVVNAALQALFALGVMPAGPGEFTRRAFLNGRIDLSRAEAVMQLISATGQTAAGAALRQLQGGALKFVQEAQGELIRLMAGLVAAIDYPEEIDQEEAVGDLAPGLDALSQRLEAACDERGSRILKEGLQVVICGKPNVGKSSLLNTLLGEEKAIVTDLPGTTRDTVSGSATLDGIPVHFTDTAGIRESGGVVEQIGIRRAREAMKAADLCLMVLDAGEAPDGQDTDILAELQHLPRLVVLNKQDLPPVKEAEAWLSAHGVSPEETLRVSARTGEGMDALRREIRKYAGNPGENALTLARHLYLAREAAQSMRQAADAMRQGVSLDLCAVDLNDALAALGRITGENVSDQLLDEVFASFCVGK